MAGSMRTSSGVPVEGATAYTNVTQEDYVMSDTKTAAPKPEDEDEADAPREGQTRVDVRVDEDAVDGEDQPTDAVPADDEEDKPA